MASTALCHGTCPFIAAILLYVMELLYGRDVMLSLYAQLQRSNVKQEVHEAIGHLTVLVKLPCVAHGVVVYKPIVKGHA